MRQHYPNGKLHISLFYVSLPCLCCVDGPVILESPPFPVNEGQAVTLRCLYKTPPSDLSADFYRDGSIIGTGTAGEMTIPGISSHEEGLYSCSNSKLGKSPESRIEVTGEKTFSKVDFLSSSCIPVSSWVRNDNQVNCVIEHSEWTSGYNVCPENRSENHWFESLLSAT